MLKTIGYPSAWRTILAGFFLLPFATLLGLAKGADEIPVDSSFFGALKARHIGPAVMGGRITSIDAVPTSPLTIYVGTAGGGVWKSVDGGTTFRPIFDPHPQSIGAVKVDPSNPDLVWVGTGEAWTRNSVSVGQGVYKSTDGGETWSRMGLVDSERISDIVVHPADSQVVYVAVTGHLWDDHEERGVYKTEDGGRTWQRILYLDEKTGCADLEMDPQEPDILYAAMWQFRRTPYFFHSGGPGSGLYRTRDGGKTWEKLSKGLPEGELGRIGVAVAPSRPNRLYAVVESQETALYRSDDQGTSWQRLDSSFNVTARPFYFADLEVDPADYRRVYKPGFSLSISRDGGESFNVSFGAVHSDLHALWIHPRDPSLQILGTDGGVYISYDRGATWRFLNSLPVSQFYHASYDWEFPYNVYGGLQDNGSWMGPSRSPNGIENEDWENLGGGDGFWVLVDRRDPHIVYFESQGGNLVRLDRRTGEAKDIKPLPGEGEPEYRFNWNTPIAFSPSRPEVLYIGGQFLFRSTDRGESWERISPDLTTNDPAKLRQQESGGLTLDDSTAENHCTIYTISESPLDPRVIWVGTDDGNLQLTRDGGHTWTNLADRVPGVPPGTWVSWVEASPHDAATAFVTFDGHRTGDKNVYVYRTRDYGRSWEPLQAPPLEGYAHVIRQDLVDPQLLFLGTEWGLFLSLDGGRNWARFEGDVPKVSVRDIAIHPREGDLIVATHGRGILILDDLTPLRRLQATFLEEEVVMLASRPAVLMIPRFQQVFPGDGTFRGANPSEVATIHYYLQRRHIFGEMRLEIYDSEGRLVSTLAGGKRRGLNRVEWNMREKPPRGPQASSLDFRALLGPAVPEGTYTVKLIKGEQSYSGSLQVVADPRSPHSPEDRALQQQTVWRLYRLQERLGYLAETARSAREQALQRMEQLAGKRPASGLEALSRDLAAFHERLVLPKRVGITQAKRLREKVIELYGSVSSFTGRPTQSQLSRADALEAQIAGAEEDFQSLVARLESLNGELGAAGLEPIRLLSPQEFAEQERFR